MPIYEFECQSGQCKTYEVWRSIDNRSTDTNCPECGCQGKRIFSPPMTLSSSLRLKKESDEPKIVRRENVESKRPRLRQSDSRPWMLNRGC
ncbi:FmdB family zinc ribbon protein [Synechococcus sp. MIT S1220]|uniref:FmdB family zinc ribbon protein n=1 Tax=Synechococcus sp. MIT S1220 TaxID=3082549 RepID=UPI0039AF585D